MCRKFRKDPCSNLKCVPSDFPFLPNGIRRLSLFPGSKRLWTPSCIALSPCGGDALQVRRAVGCSGRASRAAAGCRNTMWSCLARPYLSIWPAV